MRTTRAAWALDVAAVTARRTTCLRRAVGAVLLNSRGHVLATGYNGVAAGVAHCNDAKGHAFPHACPGATLLSGAGLDLCYAIHAEQNALLQCGDVQTIAECYVTTAPCITCTKLLMNTSCHTIVYLNDYPHAHESEALWLSVGRTWTKYKDWL